jgi:hypothetical protein
MREWPSVVPVAPEHYYIINHYGRFGTTKPRMFCTPLRRKYFAASTLKGATCHQSWKTSSTATSGETER